MSENQNIILQQQQAMLRGLPGIQGPMGDVTPEALAAKQAAQDAASTATAKAADSSSSATTAAARATDAQNRATAAAASATSAQQARDAAQNSKDASQASADAAAATLASAAKKSDLAAADGAALVGGVTPVYVLKDFRKVGGTDSEIINRALRKIESDALPGARLVFEQGRNYVYDSTHSLGYLNDVEIDLNGATLKRADSSVTTATLSAALPTGGGAVTLTLYLNSIPDNWSVNDNIAAVIGTTNAQMSSVTRIMTIDRALKKVTVNGSLDGYTGMTSYPPGTVIAKSFNVFGGRPSMADSISHLTAGANKRIRIHGGTIDGNGANQVSNSWRFSAEILLHSEGGAIYDCEIRNTAGECIVGHGLNIHANLLKDLGGSAFHTSVNDFLVAIATPSFFQWNTVRRVNLKGQTANGHSEGAVTFSWGPGQLMVSNNLFEDGGESVLGKFSTSTEPNPSRLLIITSNVCKNFKTIFYAVMANTYGVVVTANAFHDCGDNSTLTTTLAAPANRVFGNATSGNTVLNEGINAGRLGPQVVEKAGGESTARIIPDNTRIWIRQSDAPGTVPSQHAEAGLVMESANTNVISFATGPTKFAGIQYHIAGGAPIAYMVVDNSANRMILGTNRASSDILFKSGGYADHMGLLATGGTVFYKISSPITIGGETVDGSWQWAVVGSDLVFRRRVGGVWVVKQTISGA